ncbi:hypothetical protein [Mycobacterium sp. NPDC006124]|uniref:hypothetical protein n=1 Tax=Mycobacterium sp. NPDC006124 TaxID=3156729 RepID=UPI00339F9437
MDGPFVGAEALAQGTLTRHELARWHRRVLPGVYVPRGHEPSLHDRTVAAWLWSGRRGVIAGRAAAALHGADWVDAAIPIELIWRNGRPPAGLVVRHEAIGDDEVTTVCGIPVTTKTRTAFDLGRHLDRGEAVARLDALRRATAFKNDAVLRLADRYPGARGLALLRTALPLVDGGAASPRETWLRLLLVDAGLPRPTTQLAVVESRGRRLRTLDLGWDDFMVGVEYDGDQHRTDRPQYAKDVRVKRKLAAFGWLVTFVIKEDRPDEIVRSVRQALISRGWRP